MATYIRYATRAKKHTLKLDDARTRAVVDTNLSAVTILDKGTGNFTLTFIFPDRTELELDQGEVSNGDRFSWDIEELRLTNTAQAGLTVKLLVEQQIGLG